MFVAGDEFLRTQKGNNNPYNQDNETSWINWNLKKENEDFFNFFKKMIAFRKNHPSLCRSHFWRNDVQWFGVNGKPDYSYYSKSVAFYLKGEAENDNDVYVMINMHWEALNFTFQVSGSWHRIINTAMQYPDDFIDEGVEVFSSEVYSVAARSVCVFISPNSN